MQQMPRSVTIITLCDGTDAIIWCYCDSEISERNLENCALVSCFAISGENPQSCRN